MLISVHRWTFYSWIPCLLLQKKINKFICLYACYLFACNTLVTFAYDIDLDIITVFYADDCAYYFFNKGINNTK